MSTETGTKEQDHQWETTIGMRTTGYPFSLSPPYDAWKASSVAWESRPCPSDMSHLDLCSLGKLIFKLGQIYMICMLCFRSF